MEFHIQMTWDNRPVDHQPVQIQLSEDPQGCRINVEAPFFNSPSPPPAPSGAPCPQLWDYEVVETFFLNDKEQYLEVELCPHGQHLVLLLNGRKNIVQDQLPLDFKCEVTAAAGKWHGSAVVPASYLPPSVTRFNAYAIHGEGESRTYEALYPATQQYPYPDFHRLQYFGEINLGSISSSLVSASVSDVWGQHVSVST
ncbi:UPF0462 protein C4orf33 homolog [Babylonia areolata]|uniref:UPF0462 protein C4orf33 homolog n=1 Tax=Babylonia areolata TaxID=304850 RepID=UPI003FD315F5